MNEIKILRMEREHLSGVAQLERLCFSSPWSEQALELLLRQDEAYLQQQVDELLEKRLRTAAIGCRFCWKHRRCCGGGPSGSC